MEYIIEFENGICRLYCADTEEDVLTENNLTELSESEFEGARSYCVTDEEGKRIIETAVPFTEMDLAFDDNLIEELEGKYLLLHFFQNSIGKEVYEVEDIQSLKTEEEVDHGVVGSLIDKNGNFYQLEEVITEFQIPDNLLKDYFIVENGKVVELEEEDGKLYRIDE